MSFDETYSTLWMIDSYGAKCEFSTDFNSDDKEDGANGFYISDAGDKDMCPYVE
jgi:hypothetical protein